MRNQNINVTLDVTALINAIKSGAVTPKVKVDNNGNERKRVILLVSECKNQTEDKSHNVTLKADDSWRSAKGADGKVIYVGDGKPSKYQPNGAGTDASGNSQQNDDLVF